MGVDGPDYANIADGGQVNVTHPLHVEAHEDGGIDEINVGGLDGGLADEQLSSWAKVSGKPSIFTPSAHKTSHQNGGADKISVAGLGGELTDDQPPKTHKTSHENGGDDEISLEGLSGIPTALVGVAAIYTTAAAQEIPDGGNHIVDFDTKVKDTHDAVTTGAAWKFTAPEAGYYQACGAIMFTPSDVWEDGQLVYYRLYINGVQYMVLDRRGQYTMTPATAAQAAGSAIAYLNEGDYLDVRVLQSSGGALVLHNLAIYNHLSIVKFVGG